MTRPPTKADLAAAVERLTQENTALLGLIEAIGETAVLPQEAVDGDGGYYRAHRAMAITIGEICKMAADGTLSSPAWGAQYIRQERAKQEAKYEHYVAPAAAAGEPEGLEDAAAQDDDEADDGGCVTVSPAGSECIKPAGHDLIGGTAHRDVNGRRWDDYGWLRPERCGARPYPAGSEGDDGTECMLPKGHDGDHDDDLPPRDVPAVGDDVPYPTASSGLQDPAPVVRVLPNDRGDAGYGTPPTVLDNPVEHSGFIAADSPVLRGARIGGGQ